MKEAKSKIKWLAWTVFLILLSLFAYSIYLDSQAVAPFTHRSKQLELKGNFISGYRDGLLTWQVKADYVWAGRSRYLYHAESISSGYILNKKGRMIIDKIEANGIKVNQRSKTFRTSEGMLAVFNREVIDEDGEKTIRPIDIQAGKLSYFQLSNRSLIDNGVRLQQEDVVITPRGKVLVDHDEDLVEILDGVDIKSNSFEVSAGKMILYLDDDYSEMEEGIQGRRFAKDVSEEALDDREIKLREQETQFSADKLSYRNIEGQDEIKLSGNVRISQSDKGIQGDSAQYFMADDLYIIEGNVRFHTDNLNWILSPHDIQNFDNEVAQESINKSATIEADKIIFEAKDNYVKVFGNVEIKQKDKLIKAKKCEFNDETGLLKLIGNVQIDYDYGDRIKTEYIEVNIKTESVFAGKGVETEFEIQK